MRVTLTLSVFGSPIMTRTIDVADPVAQAGIIGQAAWAMYGEAARKGFGPIDTTLTVTEGEPSDATDHAKRAAAIFAQSRRGQGRR